LRIAVAQHQIRAHERMDLAALLSLSERAADEGVGLIVYPCIPGLAQGVGLVEAFAQNVVERAPQLSLVAPCVSSPPRSLQASATGLGKTLVLSGDACIDEALFPEIETLGLDALVWQASTESALQAEALMELALDASLSLAGLVLVAGVWGEARGFHSFGGSAIACLGELVAEAGDGEDLLVADLDTPVALPVRRGPRPVPAPVLAQRLAVHRGTSAPLHSTPGDA
jgi:predicted amidohydrolase